jgi:hypothetical protein
MMESTLQVVKQFKFDIQIKDFSKLLEIGEHISYRGSFNPDSVWKTNDW